MLTTIEGMQSEIFVPITPKPVFTELKKPLSECKVAFITAGGIHMKSQTPFNTLMRKRGSDPDAAFVMRRLLVGK